MSIERSAFDFVQLVPGARSLQGLETLFFKHLQPMGADFFLCGHMIRPGGIVLPKVMMATSTHEWLAYYREQHLFFEDAAAVHARLTSEPFTWSQIISWGGLTKGELKVMSEPANFRLAEGLVVPIHGAFGALGGVTVAGQHFEPDSIIRSAIQMMAFCLWRAASKLEGFNSPEPDIPKLSRRQRECLNWVQLGKNDQDIAAILQISPHTVKEHIEGAKRALGVGTRIEAIVAARRVNIIAL